MMMVWFGGAVNLPLSMDPVLAVVTNTTGQMVRFHVKINLSPIHLLSKKVKIPHEL